MIPMQFSADTKLKDILEAYPWLPETLVKMDSRFGIVNTAVGKMLIRRATLEDASKRTGFPLETIIDELEKLIQAHEGA